MSIDFDSLKRNVPCHVSIASRVPLQDLLKAATEDELDSWNNHLYSCRNWLKQPPSRKELEVALALIQVGMFCLEPELVEALLDLLNGRDFDAGADILEALHDIFPVSLEPDGVHGVKAGVPSEFLEVWPEACAPDTANLPDRFRQLDPVVDLLHGLASLYGAIPLDEALDILRSFGALDGLDGDTWLDCAKHRLHATTNYDTRIEDGLLVSFLRLGDAKRLVRELQFLPRRLPESKEALLAWTSNDFLDDTPATAAVISWAFEHADTDDFEAVKAIVSGAAAGIRCNLLENTDDIILFADDEEEWDGEDGDETLNSYEAHCRELGLYDSDLPPVLRDQFSGEQRRWALKGASTTEFRAWLASPEGTAWQEAQAARDAEAAKRNRGKKSGKKKHRRR